MAKRRMISVDVFETDRFLELPMECQIYFMHLHLMADDDGFVGNPRTLLRMYGLPGDVLRTLTEKDYLIEFESGAVAIRHWPLENRVQRDRYTPTVYQAEFASLTVDGAKGYVKKEAAVGGETISEPPAAVSCGAQTFSKEKAAPAQAEAQAETVSALPLDTGGEYSVPGERVKEYAKTYPAVDVPKELHGMRRWLLAHPEKQRSAENTERFISYWLHNAQTRARGAAPPQTKATAATASAPVFLSDADWYDHRASTVMPKLKKKDKL